MRYLAIIEAAVDGSFSAYLPDLPGCVACGENEEEARQQIEEAVKLHIESLRAHGEPVPVPSATIVAIEAA